MVSPSLNNEDKDAWLLKIELKREEPEEINKEEGIKKAMEDQAPAAEEENIPQPLPNLFTPTEIEAFKMIELARIQNKYLTQENILLKDHIRTQGHYPQVGGAFTLDVQLSTIIITTFTTSEDIITWVWALPLATAKLGGGAPVSYHHHTPIFIIFLSSILLAIS